MRWDIFWGGLGEGGYERGVCWEGGRGMGGMGWGEEVS